MFHLNSVAAVKSRRSIRMRETDVGGNVTERDRPAPQVLLKDGPHPSFEAVREMPDGKFILASGGPYVSSASVVELRTIDSLIETWDDLAAPLSVNGCWMLANGPLMEGRNASTRVFDLNEKRVLVELPVSAPFAISRSGIVFAIIRRRYDFEEDPIVDPALSKRFPELQKLIDANGGVLVACDRSGKLHFTITEQELAEPYPELKSLALSQNEQTLYYAAQRSVGAVDVQSGSLRWVQHFGENTGEHYVCLYQIALSPDETRLAVAGIAGKKEADVRILSASSGNVLDGVITSGRWGALIFHGTTLIAGGNGGRLLLLDDHQHRREIKVASGAVNDVAVINGGILCACDRRQLRWLPLLDDE